jgi:hypothetical protein
VTWPTPEKSGVTVTRTYRLSADTTAVANILVPSGSVVMTGWYPTAPLRKNGSPRRRSLGVRHASHLLCQDRAAEILLHHHILGDLGIEQGLAATAFRKIDIEHDIIGAQRHLAADFLFAVGAAIDRQISGDRVGGDFSGGPADEDAVCPRKCLGGNIALALSRIRGVGAGRGVAEQRAARCGTRGRERTDRAGRFLDHEIDVGVAVPGEF